MSATPRPTPHPSRWWYALVAVLALAGAIAGGAVVGTTLGATLHDAQAFAPGETAAVALDDGDVRGLYSSGGVTGLECDVRPPPGGGEPIVRTDVPETSAKLNGVEWRLFAEITARATGVHQVRCDSAAGVTEFGIGPAPTVRGLVMPLLAGVALVLVGGVLAVVLGVVVALRRARTAAQRSS